MEVELYCCYSLPLRNYLRDNGLRYKLCALNPNSQQRFWVYVRNEKLDLPNYNLLIEYQGQQHERPVDWFGGEEHFKTQLENDNIKRQYAKEHNIELMEIWYWDFNNIEQILSKKLNVNSNKKSA